MWVYFFQVTLSKGRRLGCQLAHQAAATLAFFEPRPTLISLETVTESPRTDKLPVAMSNGKITVQSATELTMAAG